MNNHLIWIGAVLFLLSVGWGGQPVAEAQSASEVRGDASDINVLVFTKTSGFRHGSIPTGVATLWELAEDEGFGVTATENASHFEGDNLSEYDVIIFLNTTQTILDDTQREAFQSYIQQGGGFVGVHSAADTEYEWPWYGELVGAYFDGHPPVQEADILRVDSDHPSTEHLPDTWSHSDEWYSYRDVYDGINVLLNLDETTFDLGNSPAMGESHPIAWYHEYDGGRAWYTGLGHTEEAYEDENFRRHLLGGIYWAAGIQ